MRTAQIYGDLVVDIHPQVIATAEAELEPRLIGKLGMGFHAVMLVAATVCIFGPREPTRIANICGYFFCTIFIEEPAFRCIFSESATPAKYAVFRHAGRLIPSIKTEDSLDKRGCHIATIELTRTVSTLAPGRAIAQHVNYRNPFGRIKSSKRRPIKNRSLGITLGTGGRHRRLGRVGNKNGRIVSYFNRIETTRDLSPFTLVKVRIELPLTIQGTIERNIVAALFVYTRRVVEQLVKVLFVNKALLARGCQLGLFRRSIQGRFHNTISKTGTAINGRKDHRRIDSLGTLLATLAALRIAGERRMQIRIGIVNDTRHYKRAGTLNIPDIGLAIMEAVLILQHAFFSHKEHGIRQLEQHVHRERGCCSLGFPVAVNTKHIFVVEIIIAVDKHTIGSLAFGKIVIEPATVPFIRKHRFTRLAAIGTDHWYRRLPFGVARNQHREMFSTGPRQLRTGNGGESS